ncbi:hypothetical protein PACTADRAFT_2538 [Pachysolen tannophilus NRRL Y-2460]|uniref:Enoyl reductase (ER) domain-containing protein n=1 Tax=Pachysolen tannophilus NRRL Y-2460 TaxID=669874 RepID=A0A1E4TWY5_PACTA|nr:hypothetical protein PACTADRAFT_2538 [Pachysolen tannophilus NRRL Y-2460]
MTYPDVFQGFGVGDAKKWSTPTLVEYAPKPLDSNDVDIEIEYCGICSSDLHTIKGEWGQLRRDDLVVGHEIVGTVVAVGPKVSSLVVGQRVGVGAQNLACLNCNRCQDNNEHYCITKNVSTYNKKFPNHDYFSQGGYASHHRCHEYFAFPIPDEIESKYAAPLLCGGLTVYSPLKRSGCGLNTTIGVIGIGGLGHMAIMLAKAMGAEVYAFSRSSAKKDEAIKMGADHFIATGESENWNQELTDKFDMILNCASYISGITLNSYLSILKVDKFFVNVGLPCAGDVYEFSPFTTISNAAGIKSSKLGSRKEVLELFELCAKHNIKPWIEEIPINGKNLSNALIRLDKGDVRYRFVLTNFKQFFSS